MQKRQYNLKTENGRFFQKWDDACDAVCDWVLFEGMELSGAIVAAEKNYGIPRDRLRQLMGGGDGRRMVYRRYIASEKWEEVRRQKLKNCGNKCEVCGISGVTIDVHHKNYDSLGCESMADLLAVCRSCHRQADAIRRDETEARVYEARLEAWSRKVYGKNWESHPGRSSARKAFHDWLEEDAA